MEERVFPLDNVTFEGPMIVRVFTDGPSSLALEDDYEAFWLEVKRFAVALSVSIERETLAMENDKIFVKLDIREGIPIGKTYNKNFVHQFLIKLSDCPDVLDGIYHSFTNFLERLDVIGVQAICEMTVIF